MTGDHAADASVYEQSGLLDAVGFLLARANAVSMAAGNAALADLGLRVRAFSLLMLAADPVRMTQREMAEWMRLDPSQIVPIVDDFESRGLAMRVPDPGDRRNNVVVATDLGREVLALARAATEASDRRLYSQLSDEDWATLVPLLRRLAYPEGHPGEQAAEKKKP